MAQDRKQLRRKSKKRRNNRRTVTAPPPPVSPNIERIKPFLEGRTLTSRIVLLSGHAVSRYRERFEPDESFNRARDVLARRVRDDGEYTATRPPWISLNPDAPRTPGVGWVVIDDEIALPMRENNAPRTPGQAKPPPPFAAITCLYRA